MPRRDPPVPYSQAVALIKFPFRYDRDVQIAFFYGNNTILQSDYNRVARWRRVPGLKAYVRTVYLEKDVVGAAYISFGWRRIPRVRTNHTKRTIKPYELPEERIAVKIAINGRNRGSVIKQIRLAESLRVIFHQLDLNDSQMLSDRAKRLHQGTLWCADETEQIELVGISIFGRLIRPEGGYLMQQN